MKKISTLIMGISILVFLFGCNSNVGDSLDNSRKSQTEELTESGGKSTANKAGNKAEDEIITVIELIGDFGEKLQLVSLLSDDVASAIQKNYSAYVAPQLLSKWQADPQNAPGRLVSSPWPDHIEIKSIDKHSNERYKIEGYIVEPTSAQTANNGTAAKRAVTLNVKYGDDRWLIDNVTLGDYITDAAITYKNEQYGFYFMLPKSWQGYTLITEAWNGTDLASGKQTESGPMISIRHPAWTSKDPRQDIPIMIFTVPQWQAVQNEMLSVGAAPMPPSELGRNAAYVFALPARYNFAFSEGYEEVEDIIEGQPLKPVEKGSQ